MAVVWNSADKGTGLTLTGGDLTVEKTASDGSSHGVRTATLTGGKLYFEFTFTNVGAYDGDGGVGVAAMTGTRDTWAGNGDTACLRTDGQIGIDFSVVGSLSALSNGDVVRIGVDVPNETIKFAINGGSESSAYSYAGMAGTTVGLFFTANKTGAKGTLNAGATSFSYSPFSGYTGPDAVSGYTLTAAQGSFSETGQTAGLLVKRTVAAAQGSFSETGQTAGLLVSRTVGAAQGAFALTGQAATLTVAGVGAYTLSAAQGAFALTGQEAGLRAARMVGAAQGSFALTGQAAGLRAARLIGAVQGAFTLAGQAAGLLAARMVGAVQGAFTLAGQDASLDTSGGGKALQVLVDGVWRTAAPFVRVEGVWRQATPFVRTGGVWK